MLVSLRGELACPVPEPVRDRFGRQRCVGLEQQLAGGPPEPGRVRVGASYVGAAVPAPVKAGRVRGTGSGSRVAERPARLVVADQVGGRILEDGQRRILEERFGLPWRGDQAAEPAVLLAGTVDEPPGGGAGYSFALLQRLLA